MAGALPACSRSNGTRVGCPRSQADAHAGIIQRTMGGSAMAETAVGWAAACVVAKLAGGSVWQCRSAAIASRAPFAAVITRDSCSHQQLQCPHVACALFFRHCQQGLSGSCVAEAWPTRAHQSALRTSAPSARKPALACDVCRSAGGVARFSGTIICAQHRLHPRIGDMYYVSEPCTGAGRLLSVALGSSSLCFTDQALRGRCFFVQLNGSCW